MERFLRFKDDVSLKALSEKMNDERIILLRESKTTGTIQVQILENLSSKQIKEAFKPFTITKIYQEFPYPLKGGTFLGIPLYKLRKLIVS